MAIVTIYHTCKVPSSILFLLFLIEIRFEGVRVRPSALNHFWKLHLRPPDRLVNGWDLSCWRNGSLVLSDDIGTKS